MKIFYFTGTGNSLKTAIELQKKIKNSQLVAIKDIDIKSYVMNCKKMVIISPIYYYGLPRIVEDFITNITLTGIHNISAIITAMHPDGIILKQIKELLLKKGKKLDYGVYLKMPTNFVSFFEPLNAKKRDKLLSSSLNQIDKISNDLANNRKFIQKESLLYKTITNAGKSYKNWKERVYETDKNFIIEDSCTNCGICKKVCPVGNINVENSKPTFNNRCQQCYACINLCPKKSIRYKKMKNGRYKHPDISLKQLVGS